MNTDVMKQLTGKAIRFGSKPEVYLLLRGEKRHIINTQVFFSVFRSMDEVISLIEEEEEQIPTGENITDLKLCYNDPNPDNFEALRQYYLIINERSCYKVNTIQPIIIQNSVGDLATNGLSLNDYDVSKAKPMDKSYERLIKHSLYSALLSYNVENRDTAQWMYFLDDNARLSEVSIPGTHDSITFNTPYVLSSLAQCQYSDATVKKQLDMGVRYFDIRVDEYLNVVHGIVHLDIGFSEVMDELTSFVSKTKEFLVVRIKSEITSRGDRKELEHTLFKNMGRISGNYLDHYAFTNFINLDPTVQELRGKIVIIDDMPAKDPMHANVILQFGKGINKKDVKVQDDYKRPEFDVKLQKIKDFYKAGLNDKNIRLNHVSAMAIPRKSPKAYADYLNPKVKSYLNLSHDMHLGITIFDYVDEELCKSVIAHNRFNY
ncbi:phosphatidylinositol-specific phospholipase C domain-containing protein [Gallibacter sp. Marseille-QA0791]|uniref:phosphatidylinositol-specific phospholipase C domain-containing protein n=1 Tax=Gallibacter sp. Marseille-QA0791 TaxID=3378781 RepID=UPI003D129002